jgi:hypothetical protein
MGTLRPDVPTWRRASPNGEIKYDNTILQEGQELAKGFLQALFFHSAGKKLDAKFDFRNRDGAQKTKLVIAPAMRARSLP